MTFISEILPKGPTSVRLKLACGHVQTRQDIGFRVGDRTPCPKCETAFRSSGFGCYLKQNGKEVSDAR